MYRYLLQNILLPVGSFIFPGKYFIYLKKWRYYDTLSTTQLQSIQAKKLKNILTYAQENVPFYNALNLKKGASLEDFPILTKDLLRNNSTALVSKKYKINTLEKHHSSGSSGVQSFTYMTSDYRSKILAIQTHWWEWGGFKQGDVLLQTGISPNRTFLKKVKDFLFRVTYLEAFTLNEKKINAGFARVASKNPKHLVGYPSALHVMAKHLIYKNKSLHFKSLLLHGDKVFNHYLDAYKKAFKNPTIINTYGCAEGLMMACQCDLPYYYIMSPEIFIEVVNDEGLPVAEGDVGHLLITSLSNKAMPLIRYKLGDLGALLPKNEYPKQKKFNYPLLKTLVGRETDVLTTPNGNWLTVHSFTGVLEYFPELKQYKVIKTKPNKLVIEYITESQNNLNDTLLNEIKNKLFKLIGNDMDITFNQVAGIAPSPSGKPQIIENRV